MSQVQLSTKKVISAPIVASTVIGMMMGVPFAVGINALSNRAGAVESQQATAQVTTADFAKFAYAFNQGYESRAVTASATTSAPGVCADASVTTGAGSASAASTGETSSAQVTTASAPVSKMGMGAMHAPAKVEGLARARWEAMANSYNTYTSMVYNSSSVTNTNSNNTLGSNNMTMTSVDVKDSKNVMVGVSNDPKVTQLNTNDSFNKDSYNTTTKTETNTSIVNDSFNKETNIAIDSGNTKTETTNVTKTDVNGSFNTENKVIDSGNTVNKTEDSNNTTSSTNTTDVNMTNTENKTIDSNNTTNTETNIDTTITAAKPEEHKS